MPKYDVEFSIVQSGTVRGIEANSHGSAEIMVLEMADSIRALFIDTEPEVSAFAQEVK